jgi:hypothetical protein
MKVVLFARTSTSIPSVIGPVRPRILESAVDYEHLGEFTVGEATQSEREVMTVVKAAVNEGPGRVTEGEGSVRKVVALETAYGSWLGVSVVSPCGKPPFAGIPYIEAIGTAPPYRECRLCDEVTRPGTALLFGTVEALGYLTGSPQAPPAMSAWVLPTNRSSHYMFDAGGFKRLRGEDVGCPQDVRLRDAGKLLEPRLASSVYMTFRPSP